ncbi:MAG: prepilin-type N-terminal cleavage/methylation domain-containing protein, partial [Candidatus Aminicenantes bacterium]|nr:prepilin-type N-terminal cleavage/methylation domain-containing protein [Candidatus Aminicenantes bacterium]
MIYIFNRSRNFKNGFSLIELLISMVLMMLLILGTAQLICHSLLVKRKSDCGIRAAELASKKLEHLRSLVFDSSELDDPRSEIVKDSRLNHTFTREWNFIDISPDVKKIEIDCFAVNHPRKRAQ